MIVPAIIPASREDPEQKLAQLSGLCEDVQIDIVDGVFASPASWPYANDATEPARMLSEGEMLPGVGSFGCEIDLMSTDPESSADTWVGLGATRLTIHAEGARSLDRFLRDVRTRYGADKGFAPGLFSLGLSIGSKTDISFLEPYLEHIDYVQFMGIRTEGKQGEPFDTSVLPKIRSFRKKHQEMPVQVDGGVSLKNAAELLDAGVSRLVVGSAIWRSGNPAEAYRALVRIGEEHGLYT